MLKCTTTREQCVETISVVVYLFSVYPVFSRDISTNFPTIIIVCNKNSFAQKQECYITTKEISPLCTVSGQGSVPAAGCISRDPTSRPTCFTFHCCLFRSTLVSRKKCIEFSIGNTSQSFFVFCCFAQQLLDFLPELSKPLKTFDVKILMHISKLHPSLMDRVYFLIGEFLL